MPSDCFIFQLYTLWQFHHWGLLLLTHSVGHIGFPLRALLVGSNHSESGKPKEKFILTDALQNILVCFQTIAKVDHLICEINNSMEISWLAGCILLSYGPGQHSFLAAEAWQVYWVQHNRILSVSIRWCSSCQCLSALMGLLGDVPSMQTKENWKEVETITAEPSAKHADTLRDYVNGNFCTTCQIHEHVV